MPKIQPDLRIDHRKALDEELASGPQIPHPDIAPGEKPRSMEELLRRRRPIALAGVVENGLVRLLDPRVTLPEHSRVIVVASEPD